MKRQIPYPIRLTVLLSCLLSLFVFTFLGVREVDAAMPKVFLKGYKVESLADGKLVELGALSKGKPFYMVFSTPT